jgi:branched-chain amino acid aminotransferase
MHDRDGFIWYDGQLVPWRSATTHVLTHSLHYGVAVFEGVRAYATEAGPAIFRLREHTERLYGSARVYRMAIPFSPADLREAQREVVRANGLGAAYLRPLVFFGSEKMGVDPRGARVHVAVAAWPWDAYLGPEAQQRGARVRTSSFARHPVNAVLPRAKLSGSYSVSVLASVEARDDGYDEALLLDVDGFVAEGPGENLFIVKDGRLHEPEPTSALMGITRDSVMTLARDRGYEVVSRRLTRDDVYLADEAFFCGTAVELAPIVELDRRAIGDGRPGPITRVLRAALEAATTGRDPRHADWLTPTAG